MYQNYLYLEKKLTEIQRNYYMTLLINLNKKCYVKMLLKPEIEGVTNYWIMLINDILEWNTDYLNTFDFRRRGEVGVVTFLFWRSLITNLQC